MISENEEIKNQKTLLRAGFILTGIAIIVSAISLIFLDLYANAFAGSNTVNSGDLAIIFILVTIAMIFFLIIGIIMLRMANTFKYDRTTRLGAMIITMFIFLGVSNFIFSSFILSQSSSSISSSIATSDQISGVMAIVGGILLGSALIIAANKTKISYLTAAILGLIGMPMIYFSIFYIPSVLSSYIFSNINSSHSFFLNLLYTVYIPSHILFPTGFFMSFDYVGLIAGLILAIMGILVALQISHKIISFMSYITLLIFSLGEVITGVLLLLSSSITSFSDSSNPVYVYTKYTNWYVGSGGNGLIAIYSVSQYLSIVFAVLLLVSGVLLIIYFAINIQSVLVPLISTFEKNNNISKAGVKKSETIDVKEKLIALKEQLDNGLITKEDYDAMKEELLNKL